MTHDHLREIKRHALFLTEDPNLTEVQKDQVRNIWWLATQIARSLEGDPA